MNLARATRSRSRFTLFDPNDAARAGSGIFGLPFTEKEAALVLVPVPWEVTTSYGGGTSKGPAAILKASHQMDLFDLELGRVYEPGIFLRPESQRIRRLNATARKKARRIIQEKKNAKSLTEVNKAGEELNRLVREETARILSRGKIIGLLGGDHSIPFGAFQALAEKHAYGILHFDAHFDARKAFEGFTWSHASIMYNALERIPEIEKLVQVGIRDCCEAELDYTRAQGKRVQAFFDTVLHRRKSAGEKWSTIAAEIVAALPKEVWISFDIDGLDPSLCPHTGTPVPGGLDFHEAVSIIAEVARSGRTVLGFDLSEVAPGPDGADEWDANVGMRLLYKLAGWTLASQGKLPLPR